MNAPSPKHDLVSMDDLDLERLTGLLDLSADVERRGAAYRGALDGRILGTVFFEPSTRTRLSFEAAMARLGGSVLTVAEASSSSAVKGESLADTIRVLEAYADALVLRHPRAGAARVASRYASVPVLNAGDGPGEHPSQTLLDLHVIRKERGFDPARTVMVLGDLRYGRTVHSLVKGLVAFGMPMVLVPEAALDLPAELVAALEACAQVRPVRLDVAGSTIPRGWPALSVRPFGSAGATEGAGSPTEEPPWRGFSASEVAVIYATRTQLERLAPGEEGQGRARLPVMDRRFLEAPCFESSLLLHPLPRVGELAFELDDDPRAGWFRQAAAGVPVRMALLLWAFGLSDLPGPRPREVRKVPAGACAQPACISHEEERVLGVWETPDGRCAWCGERMQDAEHHA
jgi:aspartate carbamoyltransferase catalytic subunit